MIGGQPSRAKPRRPRTGGQNAYKPAIFGVQAAREESKMVGASSFSNNAPATVPPVAGALACPTPVSSEFVGDPLGMDGSAVPVGVPDVLIGQAGKPILPVHLDTRVGGPERVA
jgi:hypothetical protein